MHPVLKHMRHSSGDVEFDESQGLVRLGMHTPETHPRVQIKRDAAEAYVPPQNVLREGRECEEGRHLKYTAGKVLQDNFPSNEVLHGDDFEKNPKTGISKAEAHLEAANLVTAYEQAVKQECNFQKTFNNNVRTLIARQEVTIGLMHLWDFVAAFCENPQSKALTAQLFLIIQHCRDEGFVREGLLSVSTPEGRWMLDLINILQTIIVQERTLSLSEKVAAINFSVITLSKHYARKIFHTPFVPLDKEAKISTFYMRAVVKILVLCDDLGTYRNAKMEKVVSGSRRRDMTDRELLVHLRHALTTGEGEEQQDAFSAERQLRQELNTAYGPLMEEEEEDEDEDVEFPYARLV